MKFCKIAYAENPSYLPDVLNHFNQIQNGVSLEYKYGRRERWKEIKTAPGYKIWAFRFPSPNFQDLAIQVRFSLTNKGRLG